MRGGSWDQQPSKQASRAHQHPDAKKGLQKRSPNQTRAKWEQSASQPTNGSGRTGISDKTAAHTTHPHIRPPQLTFHSHYQQVTYFKKWRVQDIQKRARLKELEAQGAVKMDVNTDFKQ